MWRQNLGSEPCKLLQQLCLQDDIIHILVTFMARLAVALHKLGKFCVRRSLKFNQCGVQRRTWGGEEVHSKWICNNIVWRVEVYTSSYRLQMQHLPVTLHPDSWKIFLTKIRGLRIIHSAAVVAVRWGWKCHLKQRHCTVRPHIDFYKKMSLTDSERSSAVRLHSLSLCFAWLLKPCDQCVVTAG